MLLRPTHSGAAETPLVLLRPLWKKWCCWDAHILVLLRPPVPHSGAECGGGGVSAAPESRGLSSTRMCDWGSQQHQNMGVSAAPKGSQQHAGLPVLLTYIAMFACPPVYLIELLQAECIFLLAAICSHLY